MNNFNVIYKILKYLEEALDYEEADISFISAENLKISQTRWDNIMIMLAESGYISGVSAQKTLGGNNHNLKISKDLKITLKGLEYLNENSAIKKASDIAKGIVDIIK